MSTVPTRLAAAVSLLAAMALTGANVAFGRAIAAECPVYLFLLFRFLVASAALAPLVRAEPGPRLSAMGRTELRDLVLMALLGMIGFTVLMLEGLKRTAATDAGIITATLPAVAALLGALVAGDRLSRPQAAAVGLAVAGLALVQVAGAGSGGTASLIGNLLVGGAVLCEASFVLLGKRLAPPWQPLRLALGANLAGLVLSLPLALPQMPGFTPLAVRPEMWALGTWYAVSSSVLCLWLWYRGLPYVPTWLAGLTTAAVPVTALVSAALYLGEVPGTAQLAGAGLVIAAIALGALAPPRQHADAETSIDATSGRPTLTARRHRRQSQG
jgi:drug/metabolite transporter (DMT)-like permease